jgi:hypothetical protein
LESLAPPGKAGLFLRERSKQPLFTIGFFNVFKSAMPLCYHFCYRSGSLSRHSSGRPLPFELRPILIATRSAARRAARMPFLRLPAPRG